MSGRPRWRDARTAGFTLIEVLVTLFVLAVVAGIVVIRLGDDDRQEVVDREATRIATLMEMARERATLENEEWGFTLSPETYGFLRLDQDDDRWVPLSERPFEERELPDAVTLRITLADRGRIDGQDTLVLTRDRSGPRPVLLLLSSGEMTPFSLRLVAAGEAEDRVVSSDGFAAVGRNDRDGSDG